MKIDTLELQQLAAAEAPRVDMYTGIHKALRAFMSDTLVEVGRMNVDDEAAVAHTTAQVSELLAFCASHLQHENDYVHAAMEARAPASSSAAAHDHEEHLECIEHLRQLAASLPGLPAPQRPPAAARLYRELGLFVAENFEHMHVEETAHNAVLWAHYTDAELVEIHDALVASIPPQEMMIAMRWMLPFMAPAERLGMLLDMRSKAPPPAFQAVLETIRPHLDTGAWAQLARGLGIGAVPGLVSA
jgi:hypothetical protein